jgi:hypothetical protein
VPVPAKPWPAPDDAAGQRSWIEWAIATVTIESSRNTCIDNIGVRLHAEHTRDVSRRLRSQSQGLIAESRAIRSSGSVTAHQPDRQDMRDSQRFGVAPDA